MQQPQPDWPKSLDEFRVWHERQPEVWEFIDGVPKLMAPGSKAHTVIKSNAGRLLGNALEGTGCTVLVDGAIVEVRGSSLIPDIVVTCEPLDFATPRVDEPMIIVEVLSPSGEKDDLGRKLALYLEVPSLRHYLVIHQDFAAGRAPPTSGRARRSVPHHDRRRGHAAARAARHRPRPRPALRRRTPPLSLTAQGKPPVFRDLAITRSEDYNLHELATATALASKTHVAGSRGRRGWRRSRSARSATTCFPLSRRLAGAAGRRGEGDGFGHDRNLGLLLFYSGRCRGSSSAFLN